MLLIILTFISSLSFLYYGVIFFLNAGMTNEFERYGLREFRNLVGGLQLLGGIGLLVGFVWHPIAIISAGGLALLMLIGFGVRIKMKDGFLLSLPSFIFFVLNGVIFLLRLLEIN
ncbi:DoxX family protein [Pedobacter cryoconitis]|uniref:DoxX-like protein n=1 Tax=Pedobacter cryoconitis TaxID=188932 RepID=A0A327T883_9SPHI|nr:DoxX family protein [Pedobacter cryoconitis]RAJ37398.1 DoxX-like protein [Pedobacter cryoconitis]